MKVLLVKEEIEKEIKKGIKEKKEEIRERKNKGENGDDNRNYRVGERGKERDGGLYVRGGEYGPPPLARVTFVDYPRPNLPTSLTIIHDFASQNTSQTIIQVLH